MRAWQWRVAALATMVIVAVLLAAHAGATPVPGALAREGDTPAQATITPGHIKVRGRVFYIDRNSDRSHEAAGLRVEIYDKDERAFGAYELLDTTITDSGGFFESAEISNVDPDGPTGEPEGTQDIFLKIYTDNGTVRVYETGTSQPFSWTSYQIDERDGLVRNVPDGVVGMPPLYVMENTRTVEALWTYVNLVEGWMYLRDAIGADPGQVTAYWSNTSSDGPRYSQADRAIYLRDADAGFADVVVQQEAYALLHNVYGSLPAAWADCTAGPLEGLKDSGDPACAFVQGFATYYPLAVYGETEFESLALRALDLDIQGHGSPGWTDGDTVAGRIAGALWDLHESDQTEEQYDAFNASFGDVWALMADQRPTTMAEWWSAWIAAGNDSCGALGSLFQNTIDYNTPPQLQTIGDVVLDEDTTRVFDIREYVEDLECPDDELAYTMLDAGDPEAGVILMPTNVISITPEAEWFGATNVSVSISDGPATVRANFRVVVRSVNDCPEITPVVQQVQVHHALPIVLDLLRHGADVEDEAYSLAWDVELESQDAADVAVSGRGTTKLTFDLAPHVITERHVRALVTVTDTDGCTTKQPVFLSWTARPNKPPLIWWDRLTREYVALVNTDIIVDLTDVADDQEDGPHELEWRVVNELENAGWGHALPDTKLFLRFRPHPGYIGSEPASLQVADSHGALAPQPPATAVITLTWVTREEYENLPPYVLKNRLRGKTVGTGATACYDLDDKADDPDDPQSSLRWFVINYDDSDVVVSGQGTRRMCIRPSAQRLGFEGCMTHEFVVQDPKNAESEPHDVTTCWRTIRINFPIASK